MRGAAAASTSARIRFAAAPSAAAIARLAAIHRPDQPGSSA